MGKLIKYMTYDRLDGIFVVFTILIMYFLFLIGASLFLGVYTSDFNYGFGILKMGYELLPLLGIIIILVEIFKFSYNVSSEKNNLYFMLEIERSKIFLSHIISTLISILALVGSVGSLYILCIMIIPDYSIADNVAEFVYTNYQNFPKYFLMLFDLILILFSLSFFTQLVDDCRIKLSTKSILIGFVVLSNIIAFIVSSIIFSYNIFFLDSVSYQYYASLFLVFSLILFNLFGSYKMFTKGDV